jgi:hypothetical protein
MTSPGFGILVSLGIILLIYNVSLYIQQSVAVTMKRLRKTVIPFWIGLSALTISATVFGIVH